MTNISFIFIKLAIKILYITYLNSILLITLVKQVIWLIHKNKPLLFINKKSIKIINYISFIISKFGKSLTI